MTHWHGIVLAAFEGRPRMRRLLLTLWLLLLAAPAFGQTSYPSQLNPRNTQTVSTASAAAAKTLTGVAGRAWRVYEVSGWCSTGTSGFTIAEAAVTTWSTPAAAVTTALTRFTFPPYTAAAGASVVITLAACGSGNTATLNVLADVH